MRGNEFLDNMELIDPAFIEEADQESKRKRKSQKLKALISRTFAKEKQGTVSRK